MNNYYSNLKHDIYMVLCCILIVILLVIGIIWVAMEINSLSNNLSLLGSYTQQSYYVPISRGDFNDMRYLYYKK
jgi:hypothetical protein